MADSTLELKDAFWEIELVFSEDTKIGTTTKIFIDFQRRVRELSEAGLLRNLQFTTNLDDNFSEVQLATKTGATMYYKIIFNDNETNDMYDIEITGTWRYIDLLEMLSFKIAIVNMYRKLGGRSMEITIL